MIKCRCFPVEAPMEVLCTTLNHETNIHVIATRVMTYVSMDDPTAPQLAVPIHSHNNSILLICIPWLVGCCGLFRDLWSRRKVHLGRVVCVQKRAQRAKGEHFGTHRLHKASLASWREKLIGTSNKCPKNVLPMSSLFNC